MKLIGLILACSLITNSYTSDQYAYYADCVDYNREIYCLTNDVRKDNDLPLLIYSDELEAVSKQKSDDMCNRSYFSHDYNGKKWHDYLDKSGIGYVKAGENLSRKFDTPQKAVEALVASPTHFDNLVGDYTHIGVYTASCDGMNYTTQTFAKL